MHKIEEEKITEMLSKLFSSKEPSDEFEKRLNLRLKSELQQIQQREETASSLSLRMNMEKIQRIIGMAVTNESFRKNLFENAKEACLKAGFSLTELELASLKNLKEEAVAEFAEELDKRISKKAFNSL